jgi:hypothetical protein
MRLRWDSGFISDSYPPLTLSRRRRARCKFFFISNRADRTRARLSVASEYPSQSTLHVSPMLPGLLLGEEQFGLKHAIIKT